MICSLLFKNLEKAPPPYTHLVQIFHSLPPSKPDAYLRMQLGMQL